MLFRSKISNENESYDVINTTPIEIIFRGKKYEIGGKLVDINSLKDAITNALMNTTTKTVVIYVQPDTPDNELMKLLDLIYESGDIHIGIKTIDESVM